LPVEIGTEARSIVERLERVSRGEFRVDPLAAEQALAQHFRALGLEPLPVRWVTDAEAAYLAVFDKARGAAEAARSAAESAAWSAARSAARSAAPSSEKALSSRAELDKAIGIWLPFVDAVEAGLWLFFPTADEVIAVARPAMQVVDDDLHCEDGPAVAWPGGARYWFWRGVQVPQKVVEAPESLTAAEINEEQNVEVRRVMQERFGYDRYLKDSNAKLLQTDDFGALWWYDNPGDEPLVMVELLNATPEPDGSVKTYFLRVPPTMKTAREAVAWTFEFSDGEYEPAVES
jgi:hypothetical protein